MDKEQMEPRRRRRTQVEVQQLLAEFLRRQNTLLILLTLASSVLWWWPVCIEPNIDLPGWLPLIFVAIWMVFATILSGGHWLRLLGACAVGNFVGLVALAIWWPTDPIARPFLPVAIPIATVAAMIVSLMAGLTVRKISVSNSSLRRVIWVALMCCFVLELSTIAATPRLVAHKVRANDRVAIKRFIALKEAVEQTMAQPGGAQLSCNGSILKRSYLGPTFTETDWQRIAGNYVMQGGYVFMVYCHETGGYTIDTHPARIKGDGTLQLCTDESRKIGCGEKWNGSRHACMSCEGAPTNARTSTPQ